MDRNDKAHAVPKQTERKPATRIPPQPKTPFASVWSPRMTEQEKKEFDQYVKDNDLPF